MISRGRLDPRLAPATVTLLLLVAGCGGSGAPGAGEEGEGSRAATDAPSPDGAPAESAPAILFHGARLVIGDGRVVEDGALLVEGDRIVAVGPAGEVENQAPGDAARLDLTGRTVIPALLDAHVHLGFEGEEGWSGENYGRRNVVGQLELMARHGVGAVFSAGTDPNRFAVGLREDQRAGRLGGARLFFGAGMAPPGQGPNQSLLDELAAVDEAGGQPVVRGAATPEAGREQVREIAEMGIRFVKLWVDDRGGTQEKLPPEIYHAVTDEAHRLGLRVFVHHQTLEDMKETARAGVDGYLHGRFGPEYAGDDELIRLLRESGAFVVPNLGIAQRRGPPPPGRQAEIRAAMRRFQDAGIPLVLGTDGGAVPGHPLGASVPDELEIYVRSGLTPHEALTAATSAAARALGLTDETGALEAGRSADFVVLEGDPLEDIAAVREIEAVWLRGVEVQ